MAALAAQLRTAARAGAADRPDPCLRARLLLLDALLHSPDGVMLYEYPIQTLEYCFGELQAAEEARQLTLPAPDPEPAMADTVRFLLSSAPSGAAFAQAAVLGLSLAAPACESGARGMHAVRARHVEVAALVAAALACLPHAGGSSSGRVSRAGVDAALEAALQGMDSSRLEWLAAHMQVGRACLLLPAHETWRQPGPAVHASHSTSACTPAARDPNPPSLPPRRRTTPQYRSASVSWSKAAWGTTAKRQQYQEMLKQCRQGLRAWAGSRSAGHATTLAGLHSPARAPALPQRPQAHAARPRLADAACSVLLLLLQAHGGGASLKTSKGMPSLRKFYLQTSTAATGPGTRN